MTANLEPLHLVRLTVAAGAGKPGAHTVALPVDIFVDVPLGLAADAMRREQNRE